MSERGFAVAARHGAGVWLVDLVPEAVVDDLDECLAAIRAYAGRDGVLVLMNVGDDCFLAVRLDAAGRTRYLLSDATAAFDWPLARAVLSRVDAEPALDPRHGWPAGDLELFSDLGVPGRKLRMLLDNIELYADELLGYLAESLGFGDQYALVVDALPGTLTT